MTHILHRQIYAGLMEIIKDEKLYYHSPIGNEYCQLRDGGKEAVIKWLELMAPQMLELEKQQLDARAKKMMWEELKK
jgi:hypothetical protein